MKNLLTYETTERNDKNNWVKQLLLKDGLQIIEFEGYTIKESKCTGLFDRRLFNDSSFLTLSDEQVHNLIIKEEPLLHSKLEFSKKLGAKYRYVFYSYGLKIIRVYTFENNSFKFKIEYDNFCSFIKDTMKIRDLQMTSNYEEDNLPEIDKIFRYECHTAWMGNLDAVFVSKKENMPSLLVEFQTTIKDSVSEHCNNKYFAKTEYRKGDEQRWKVFDCLSKESGLDLVIIVWSPKEKNGNIKLKVVDKIVYSNDINNENPGLFYKYKNIESYSSLILV